MANPVAGINNGVIQIEYPAPQGRPQTPPASSAITVEDTVALSSTAKSGMQLHVSAPSEADKPARYNSRYPSKAYRTYSRARRW